MRHLQNVLFFKWISHISVRGLRIEIGLELLVAVEMAFETIWIPPIILFLSPDCILRNGPLYRDGSWIVGTVISVAFQAIWVPQIVFCFQYAMAHVWLH